MHKLLAALGMPEGAGRNLWDMVWNKSYENLQIWLLTRCSKN